MEQNIRRILAIFAVPFIGSLTLLSLAAAFKLSQPGIDLSRTPTIGVSGEGKVTVKPDVAELSFSVINQGSDPALLQTSNDTRMKTAIDYLKSQGVKEEDIKTTAYVLLPQYEHDVPQPLPRTEIRPPRIIGYTLTQTVNAKLRDLLRVGSIVGGLTEQGVNQINGISFFVENPEEFRAKAREEAILKAQTQAASIAARLGVKLGRITNFHESPIFYPPPFAFGVGGGLEKGGGFAAPIEPGSQEITVMVNINYAIK
jgi:uncharacterized protein YggE